MKKLISVMVLAVLVMTALVPSALAAKGATLLCNARDFYYPLPKPKAERPAEWDMHVRDWAGRTIGFSFEA